jgi:hypothetical protein
VSFLRIIAQIRKQDTFDCLFAFLPFSFALQPFPVGFILLCRLSLSAFFRFFALQSISCQLSFAFSLYCLFKSAFSLYSLYLVGFQFAPIPLSAPE